MRERRPALADPPIRVRRILPGPRRPTGVAARTSDDRDQPVPDPGIIPAASVGPGATPPRPGRSRWSASGWAIIRADGGNDGVGVATPQLGGSQAGVRIAFALTPSLAVAARAAAALRTRQQEAALGLEWALPALPLRLVAERRIGVARSRGGWGAGIVGGVAGRRVAGALRLDGYGQAGAIVRGARAEGYADGAIRLSHPLWQGAHGAAIDLGVGAWGAAQRGAARLDAGPALGVVVPVAGTHVRVAAEWRERLSGNARPTSGPALSIGADL